jgi:hypothetical protein
VSAQSHSNQPSPLFSSKSRNSLGPGVRNRLRR